MTNPLLSRVPFSEASSRPLRSPSLNVTANRGAVRVAPRFAVTLRLGLRSGLEEASENGTLESNGFVIGGGASAAVTDPERPFGLDAVVRLDAITVAYVPDPVEGAVGHPDQATALVASAGLAATLRPSKALRVALEATAGLPLRTVRATDGGADLTSIEGA